MAIGILIAFYIGALIVKWLIGKAIDATGLQHRVRLLGRLGDAELTDIYQGADLFLMPNIPIPGDMEMGNSS